MSPQHQPSVRPQYDIMSDLIDADESFNIHSRLHYQQSGKKKSGRGKSGVKRARSVSFQPKTTSRFVPTIAELPEELLWYSQEEYDFIKACNSKIIKMVKSGDFEEDENFSARGLEHKLKEVFRQRRANKFNALNAVLEEQDRQLNRGISDPDMIALAYRSVTERCYEAAAIVALRDYNSSYNWRKDVPVQGKQKEEKSSKSKMKGVRRVLHGTRKKMMRRLSL